MNQLASLIAEILAERPDWAPAVGLTAGEVRELLGREAP